MLRYIPIKILLSFVLLSFTGNLCAQDPFFLYEDTSGSLKIKDIVYKYQQGKFLKTTKNHLNKGFTRSIFWLAFDHKTDTPTDSLLLQIGDFHINEISFFFFDTPRIYLQAVSGDYHPLSKRYLHATGFYFPVNKKGLYFAKIDRSNETLQLSYRLVAKNEALQSEAKNKVILFFFTGMICLLLILVVGLWIIQKDKIYYYYLLYIATAWILVLCSAGYTTEYFWPESPWLIHKSRAVLVLLPHIFLIPFLKQYTGIPSQKKAKRFIKILNGLAFITICLILIFPNTQNKSAAWWYIQFIIVILILLYTLIVSLILLLGVIHKNRFALFYLAATSFLIVCIVTEVLFVLGQYDRSDSFISNYGIAVGIVIEVVILTGGLVYRFNQYRLEKEALQVEIKQRQLENARIMIQVQESERSQIANQLHDVAGSLLSAIKLNISSLSDKIDALGAQTKIQLQKTGLAIDQVSDVIRNLSHALSPAMLEQFGFAASIKKIISIFNASGKVSIELVMLGFEKYNPLLNNYYTTLYSITYELLNNVIKHANANNILLQIIEHDDAFTLIIEDDGKGPDSNFRIKKEGIGINAIESKIIYMNGSIAFDTNEGKGLIVTIEIPISK